MKLKKKVIILLISVILFQCISPVLAILNKDLAIIAYAESLISSYAFEGNGKLEYLEIPAGIAKLNSGFVSGENNLKKIEIPETVTEISGSAFENMNKLKEINVNKNNPKYSSEDGILYNKDKTTLIRVPKGRNKDVTIPETVTKIEEDAFYYCEQITKVEMSNKV